MTDPFQSTEEWQPDQENLITFVLADTGAIEVPGLGTSWDIEISVAGAGVLQTGQGTKSEIGSGWYAYLTTAGEASSSQPGPRSIRITHPSIAQQNLEYFVAARDVGSRVIQYFVANVADGQPLPGVQVWFTTTPDSNANPFWVGTTDFTGGVKGADGNDPRVGVGEMYAWKFLSGYTDVQNPHLINTDTTQIFAGSMAAVVEPPDPGGEIPPSVQPSYLWANPDEFQKYWFWDFGDEETYEQLWPLLRMASSRVTASLSASGQLDCPRSEWGDEHLKELVIIIAGIMFNTPAVRLSNEQRQLYQLYATEALRLLRTGELTICEGETARGFPAWETARYGLTERNAARIIAQEEML
jgi:hypothetical protein